MFLQFTDHSDPGTAERDRRADRCFMPAGLKAVFVAGSSSVAAVGEASDAGEEGCRKVADDVTLGFNAVWGMQRQIHSGQYHSAEEVLRAAMDQFEQMDIVGLKRSAIDETAGHVVSLHTVATSIRQKHRFSDPQ